MTNKITMRLERKVSRIITIWIMIVLYFFYATFSLISEDQRQFFMIGPSDKLVIFGIKINNYYKYQTIIFYCFINSIIRATNHNILAPWITNSVQDITNIKTNKIKTFAYEATFVATIYSWVDWYIYVNILLSQVDMIVVEIVADLLATGCSTYYYLNYSINVDHLSIKNPKNINNDFFNKSHNTNYQTFEV